MAFISITKGAPIQFFVRQRGLRIQVFGFYSNVIVIFKRHQLELMRFRESQTVLPSPIHTGRFNSKTKPRYI